MQAKRCEAVLLLKAACFFTEEDVIAVYKEVFRSMQGLFWNTAAEFSA